MSKSSRRWVLGAFVVTLIAASIGAWRAGGRGFEATASAASKHGTPSSRQSVETPLLSAPELSFPAPLPAPPRPARTTTPPRQEINLQGAAALPALLARPQ